mgnify:CR=1 FL=1|tara:strand:+ start:1527 stop:1751 length:225 start_codon:yes stop_codon:yes gene_type:complete
MPNLNKYYSQVVTSTTTGDEYLVSRWPDGGWKCTCKDFYFRSYEDPDHKCKHINKVNYKLVLDAMGEKSLRSTA